MCEGVPQGLACTLDSATWQRVRALLEALFCQGLEAQRVARSVESPRRLGNEEHLVRFPLLWGLYSQAPPCGCMAPPPASQARNAGAAQMASACPSHVL